jgi:hypothetical protein
LVIAITIPIRTNTTIAICIQIQVGDIGSDSLLRRASATLAGTATAPARATR